MSSYLAMAAHNNKFMTATINMGLNEDSLDENQTDRSINFNLRLQEYSRRLAHFMNLELIIGIDHRDGTIPMELIAEFNKGIGQSQTLLKKQINRQSETKFDLLLDSWEDIFPSKDSRRYLQSHLGLSANLVDKGLFNQINQISSQTETISDVGNVIIRFEPSDILFTEGCPLYRWVIKQSESHNKVIVLNAIAEDKYYYTDDQQKELRDHLDAKIQNYINHYKPDRVFIVIETSGSFGSVLACVARRNKCVTTLINKFDQEKDVDEETRRYSRELGAYIRQHNLLID